MFEVDGSFHVSSGGEGPARTALSLVLDASNSTQLGPVKRSRWVSTSFDVIQPSGSDFFFLVKTEFRLVSQVDVLEFTDGQISEFVEFHLVRAVAGIVFVDNVHVGSEDFISVEEFFGGIRFALSHHPIGEGLLVFHLRGGSHNNEDYSEDEEGWEETFLIKFSTKELAEEFKREFEKALPK